MTGEERFGCAGEFPDDVAAGDIALHPGLERIAQTSALPRPVLM